MTVVKTLAGASPIKGGWISSGLWFHQSEKEWPEEAKESRGLLLGRNHRRFNCPWLANSWGGRALIWPGSFFWTTGVGRNRGELKNSCDSKKKGDPFHRQHHMGIVMGSMVESSSSIIEPHRRGDPRAVRRFVIGEAYLKEKDRCLDQTGCHYGPLRRSMSLPRDQRRESSPLRTEWAENHPSPHLSGILKTSRKNHFRRIS
jgi:hypothetical protein